jgi:hypothetical protein
MALTVDQVPGYLFYYTGLRGFQMLPDGDRQFFEEYRRRGAALVIIRPKVVKEAPWLQDILGVRLAGGQNWAVHRLR